MAKREGPAVLYPLGEPNLQEILERAGMTAEFMKQVGLNVTEDGVTINLPSLIKLIFEGLTFNRNSARNIILPILPLFRNVPLMVELMAAFFFFSQNKTQVAYCWTNHCHSKG